MATCPICESEIQPPEPSGFGIQKWNCPRCGKFIIDFPIVKIGVPKDISTRLSAYTRSQSPSSPPALTAELFEIVRAMPEKTVREKAVKLLELIESRSEYFGQPVQFKYSDDFPLIEAKNDDEFKSICDLEVELANTKHDQTDSKHDIALSLTAKGYDTIEAMRQTNVYSEKVFVAMSFNPSLKPIYDNEISSAIEDAGYKPIRIDLEDHNDDIIARVISEIRESRFVVADFTGHRNGVYFETGYAKGLGLEVVWLCRNDEIGKAHFDTEHFNHLVWKDGESFRDRLLSRIMLTIGPGPLPRNR